MDTFLQSFQILWKIAKQAAFFWKLTRKSRSSYSQLHGTISTAYCAICCGSHVKLGMFQERRRDGRNGMAASFWIHISSSHFLSLFSPISSLLTTPWSAIRSLSLHDCCSVSVIVLPARNSACYNSEEIISRQCGCSWCGGRGRVAAEDLAEHWAAVAACGLQWAMEMWSNCIAESKRDASSTIQALTRKNYITHWVRWFYGITRQSERWISGKQCFLGRFGACHISSICSLFAFSLACQYISGFQ